MKNVVLCCFLTISALGADESSLTFDHARAALYQPSRDNPPAYWDVSIGFTKPVNDTDLTLGRAGFKIFDELTDADVALVRIESGTSTGPAPKIPSAVHDSPAIQAFKLSWPQTNWTQRTPIC